MDKETGPDNLTDLPKAAQPESGKVTSGIQVLQTKSSDLSLTQLCFF